MTIDDCFEIGYITRTVGLRGEVLARLEIENPNIISNIKKIYCQQSGTFVPLEVIRWAISSKKNKLFANVRFKAFDNLDAVLHLKGTKLFLPLTVLPKLDKENQFYYHQVLGYQIVDKKLGKLGIVEQIYDLGNNDLMMMKYREKEVLIPMSREIVISCNHQDKTLNTDLPDGLLDLYLNP